MTKNYCKLRGRAREKGLTLAKLAEKIGISSMSLGNKLAGKTDFTLTEIKSIVSALDISPEYIPAYFFTAEVKETEHLEGQA